MLSKHTNASIINGGDGNHAHPTQALLDLMTLQNHFVNLDGKKIAIVGDIINSRVASSNLELLPRFGMDITLVGPKHFLPATHHKTSNSINDIIDNVDAIMSLRTQTERHDQPIYKDLSEYGKDYCITKDLLGSRDIALLHPGPVHRNIDISDELLDGKNSLVLTQVKNGVAMRMAILEYLLTTNG
jgi:aspartate carbamoyltransferase catalytic subunit